MSPLPSKLNRFQPATVDFTETLKRSRQIVVQQKMEPVEVVTGIETANRYSVFNDKAALAGYVNEQTGGPGTMLSRQLFGSHRNLTMGVSDHVGNKMFDLNRPFYWILSDLKICGNQGKQMGCVQQCMGIFRRKYNLFDSRGVQFAQIRSDLLNFWSFSIYDEASNEVGSITKQWGGLLKEYFSDSDSFLIDYGDKNWSLFQRAVIFGAALSIDLDFFEDNSRFKPLDLLGKLPLKVKPTIFNLKD